MNKLYGYGFSFIPTSNKHPAIVNGKMMGATSATRDRAKVEDWMATAHEDGFGISVVGGKVEGTEKYLVILDVDVKKENGITTLDDLEAEYGLLPRTLTVNTPSGGLHCYFLSPVEIGSSVDSFADKFEKPSGIDIKGKNGYVQAPPTAGYEFASDLPPADLPITWVTLLKGLIQCERGIKSKFSIPKDRTIVTDYNKKNDIRVTLMKHGYKHEGGNFFTHPFGATTVRNVVILQNKGFFQNGSEYISFHFGAHDRIKGGPHDSWDIARLLSYGGDHDLMVRDYKGDKPEFDLAYIVPAATGVSSELGLELIEDHFRVGDIFSITGQSQTCKTFLIMDMAFSMACGQKFLNKFDVRTPVRKSVLYCSESRRDFCDRRMAWTKIRSEQWDIPEAELIAMIDANVGFSSQQIPLVGKDAKAAYDHIHKYIKFKPDVIFLDHYSFHFSRNGYKEENSNSEGAHFLGSLSDLVVREDASLGLIHHPDKGENSNYRGASVFFNNIPLSYHLKEEEGGKGISVAQTKCSYYNGHKSYLMNKNVTELYIDKGSINLKMRTGLTLEYADTFIQTKDSKVGRPQKLTLEDLKEVLGSNIMNLNDFEKALKNDKDIVVSQKTLNRRLEEGEELEMFISSGPERHKRWRINPEFNKYE
jgi:hypothetical protein